MKQNQEQLNIVIFSSLIKGFGAFFKTSGGDGLFEPEKNIFTTFDAAATFMKKAELCYQDEICQILKEIDEEDLPADQDKSLLAKIVQEGWRIADVVPKTPRHKRKESIKNVLNNFLHEFYILNRPVSQEYQDTKDPNLSSYPDSSCEEDNYVPLHSIFNTLAGKSSARGKVYYHPIHLLHQDTVLPPAQEYRNLHISSEDYRMLSNKLISMVIEQGEKEKTPQVLLELAEMCLSSIPSHIKEGFSNDVSFYEQIKISTAIAGALYVAILNQEGEEDCAFDKIMESNQKDLFLILKCQVQGTDSFIHKVSPAGSLSTLQARSLWVKLLTESLTDEILEIFGLCRANIIARHQHSFELLLPNLPEIAEILENIEKKIHRGLMDSCGSALSCAFSYETLCIKDLMGCLTEEDEAKSLMIKKLKHLKQKSLKALKNPYSIQSLQSLFSRNTSSGSYAEYYECSACGSGIHQEQAQYFCEDKVFCDVCRLSEFLGQEKMPELLLTSSSNDIVKDVPALEVPSIQNSTKNFSVMHHVDESGSGVIYTYGYSPLGIQRNIWSLNTLPPESFLNTGQKNLGQCYLFLRLDSVEDLIDTVIHQENFNITKYSTLIDQVNLILTKGVQDIIQSGSHFVGELLTINPSKGMPQESKSYNRFTLLSQGTETLFLTGMAEDLLHFTVILKRFIKKYTGTRITVSAAMDLFPHDFPVFQVYQSLVNTLGSSIKPHHNSISLFKHKIDSLFGTQASLFSWNDFETVLYPHLSFLFEHCTLKDTVNNTTHKDKLIIDTCFLHSLQQAFITPCKEKDFSIQSLNIAHLLNQLERSSHPYPVMRAFKNRILKYIKAEDRQDLKELVVAIDLFTYISKTDKIQEQTQRMEVAC